MLNAYGQHQVGSWVNSASAITPKINIYHGPERLRITKARNGNTFLLVRSPFVSLVAVKALDRNG